MPYNFCNRPNPSQRNKCVCSSGQYHVPRYAEIPSELLDLSTRCVFALRPFHLDFGMYSRKKHGCGVGAGMIKLEVSSKCVLEIIRDLPDREENVVLHTNT